MDVKDISSLAPVAAMAESDVALVRTSDGLHPISFANLANAVRNTIQIGGRNLLLNSNTPKLKSQNYAYSKRPEIGKTYAITGCITADQGVTQVILSMNGGNLYNTVRVYNPTPGEKTILKGVLTVARDCPYLFIHAIGGDVTCHWAVIVEGNMPVTDWIPAPEDLWGG